VAAAGVIARWLDRRERMDELMAWLPDSLSGTERARCQNLVFGVMRHAGRLEAELGRIVAHPPRFPTRAVLYLAGFELIEAAAGPDYPGRSARIVHHAVEQAKARTSPAEARLVNAVARKLAAALAAAAEAPAEAGAEALAEYYSHPLWLVRRWLAQFGAPATRTLLQWNQQPAPVYARLRGQVADNAAGPPDGVIRNLTPSFLKPTAWPHFYEIPSGHWAEVEALLQAGAVYIQDPATRLPVELLAPQPGETVLDACAAPGGKSLLIADTMAAARVPDLTLLKDLTNRGPTPSGGLADFGSLIALDLPGERIDRLTENLAHIRGVTATIVPGDVRRGASRGLEQLGLPAVYSAVLLDVPCTNTGVMRHRIDVKWRLQEGDFRQHAQQQLALLTAAARLVAPGGRLVYSTCSVDREENQGVVEAFLKEEAGAGFRLEAQQISYPWDTGHDGGGAFLLKR
jgi:16S rRNA (cytosine967-C5)-methyltransferase